MNRRSSRIEEMKWFGCATIRYEKGANSRGKTRRVTWLEETAL